MSGELSALWLPRHPRCPHCGHEIDVMADCDFYPRHVTYHGEDGPREDGCPNCHKPIFLLEAVHRTWSIGRTADEAREP